MPLYARKIDCLSRRVNGALDRIVSQKILPAEVARSARDLTQLINYFQLAVETFFGRSVVAPRTQTDLFIVSP